MKAMVFKRYGPLHGIKLKGVPKPTPEEDEVLLKVHASSINYKRVLTDNGTYAMTPCRGFSSSCYWASGHHSPASVGNFSWWRGTEQRHGRFQLMVQPLLSVLNLLGVDLLEQNEWERDSLLMGKNGADGIRWVLIRPVKPTETPFVGAYVHKDRRGPMNCSIYDHGDFCLYCVASIEWDMLVPHVSTGPQI